MSARKLDLKTFLDGISIHTADLISEYFDSKAREHGRGSLLSDLSTDCVISYLDRKEDQEIKDEIRQDFMQINDLCGRSMWLLVDEINRRGIPADNNECKEALGMRVFLRHKAVFEYAHDQYYFRHCSGRISEHNISYDGAGVLRDEQKVVFAQKVKNYFASSAKGGNSLVRFHREGNRLMVAVVRGCYKRVASSWRDDSMKATCTLQYRPAKEDILDYDFEKQKLYIKASSNKDRELYICAFVECIVGNINEMLRRDRDETFNLSVLQDSRFRFDLDSTIQAVYLLEVGVSVAGARNPMWILRSSDVLSSLKDDVSGLGLHQGTIRSARFLFRLKIGNKLKKVTFDVAPPNSADLNKKKYADIITRYLERVGLKNSAQTSARTVVEDARALVQ